MSSFTELDDDENLEVAADQDDVSLELRSLTPDLNGHHGETPVVIEVEY